MGSAELLFVVVVLAVLMIALRVFFGRADRPQPRKREYGLLREVAVAPSARAAETVTGLLREHGIRATTAPRTDADGLRILVFPADEHRAVRVLLDEPWSTSE